MSEWKTGRKLKHHNRAEDWKKAKASQEWKTGRKQKHHDRVENWKVQNKIFKIKWYNGKHSLMSDDETSIISYNQIRQITII